MLCEHDEPGWVMGMISKTVLWGLQRFRQKQMKLDELTQLAWGDAADYFHARDENYGASELTVLAVVKLQSIHEAAAPAHITFGDLMQSLDIV